MGVLFIFLFNAQYKHTDLSSRCMDMPFITAAATVWAECSRNVSSAAPLILNVSSENDSMSVIYIGALLKGLAGVMKRAFQYWQSQPYKYISPADWEHHRSVFLFSYFAPSF